MWRRFIACVVPDVSEESNASIFKGQTVKENLIYHEDASTTLFRNFGRHSPNDAEWRDKIPEL